MLCKSHLQYTEKINSQKGGSWEEAATVTDCKCGEKQKNVACTQLYPYDNATVC